MHQQLVDDITVVPGAGGRVFLQVGGQEPPGLVCRAAEPEEKPSTPAGGMCGIRLEKKARCHDNHVTLVAVLELRWHPCR